MPNTGLKPQISIVRRICLESRLESMSGGLNRTVRGYHNLDKDIK